MTEAHPESPIVEAFRTSNVDSLASIFYGIYDRITDHGHALAHVVVAPADAHGDPDWEKAHPTNLELPVSDAGPTDLAEAKRWAVLVDNIVGCDEKTSMLIWLDATTGQPNMAQIAGPTADGDIAMRILGRDIGAAPPAREFKLGPLAQSMADFMEKRAPANDNLPPAENDPAKARLERQQKRYGGEVTKNGLDFYFVKGATYKGEVGHIFINAKTDVLEFFKHGTKRAVEIVERRSAPTTASAFTLGDPSQIPPREWLYGHHFARRYLTATVGAGGGGKSSLAIVEALAMVTGRPLLDPDGPLSKPLRVWYVNIEDPVEEIARRFHAAAKHYNVTNDKIGGRLFTDSGRDQEFVIMHQRGREFVVCEPLVEDLVDEIRRREIDVLIVDPFVSTHEVPENDNNLIQRVAAAWVSVADRANCSIEVIHHVTKGDGEVTADSARGGGALKDKTRSMRTINLMSEREAEKAGLDDHHGYFRLGLGKTNMVRQTSDQKWHRLASVALMNGRGIIKTGDEIGVVERWFWPSPDAAAERKISVVAEVSPESLAAIKVRLNAGDYRHNEQARNWAGIVVGEALGIDLTNKAEKTRVKEMLSTWTDMGHFEVVQILDHRRHPATHLKPLRDPEN